MKRRHQAAGGALATWVLLFGLLCGDFLGTSTRLLAQTSSEGQVVSNFVVDREVFGGGIFYFAIMEQATSRFVIRGKMDVEGVDRVILAPETAYRFMSFYAETLSLGVIDFVTPPAGRTFQIACMDYRILVEPSDKDGDDFPDELEYIAGTNENNPDTDGDGFSDGSEVRQGRDPLDGFFVDTGIIASGLTPGDAIDLCVINNIAMVACGTAGVTVFNIKNGAAPLRVAQIDTPGQARAVTCFSNLIGVADGSGGLAIIDISDPPAARIVHQLRLGADANAVVARGNLVFVGLVNGTIVVVDMVTGTEVSRFTRISGVIQDLGERRGYLYALVAGTLHTLRIFDGELELVDSDASPGGVGAGQVRLRMFVATDTLYTVFTSGYNIFSISNLGNPNHLQTINTAQAGWKQIIPNGTGLAVATVSANSTPDGAHDVGIYEVGDDLRGFRFLSTFETPGRAMSVFLSNGLAFIADSASGLQVINYQAFDTQGVPPEITLELDTTEGNVEEGKVFSARTEVSDDVMVRSVEFFINGTAVALDGSYPFELGLVSPSIVNGVDRFTVYAVATDTGGNTRQSEVIEVGLVPDATPIRVRKVTPGDGAITGTLGGVLVGLSEPANQSTLNGSSVQMFNAGPDGVAGNGDDLRVSVALDYSEQTASLALTPNQPFEPGLYQLVVQRPLADIAGNRIAQTFRSAFRIYGFDDQDRDGVPDDLEPALGLNPENPDTDGNGVPDGLEDRDGDGLPNVGEVVLNQNPFERDTDLDGIPDGLEDSDLDGLNDGDEIRRGTNAEAVDSDGDGVDDPTEIAEGTNPLDSRSRPKTQVNSLAVSYLNGAVETLGGLGLPISIVSKTASYLNALPIEIDEDFRLAVASAPVSYLNGTVGFPDELIIYPTTSRVVSYLNAGGAPDPDAGQRFTVSPVVSYDHQTVSSTFLNTQLEHKISLVK